MSPNTKIDSSSPPTNGHQISSSAPSSTATGLISPFAHATTTTKGKGAHHHPSNPNNNIHLHQNQTESDFSLPLGTPQIDTYQISHLTQARHRIKQSIIAQSPLLSSNDKEYIFPRFDKNELVLGDVLGSGGFGTVLEIQGIRLLTENTDDDNAANVTDANNNTKKNLKQQSRSRRRPSRIKCRSFDESQLKQPTTTTTNKHHDVHRKSPVANITRGIRTKALSFNAKAHEVIPDVGHFFHHHRGSGSGAIGEEKECVETTAREINEYQDGIPSAATWNGSELQQQQEQQAANEQEEPPQQPRQQQQQQTPPKRQISRNFSLKAWRESDPGDEGKDAISLEEMERYKVEYSNSRHGAAAGGTSSSSSSANIGEEEDGKFKAVVEDEGCDLQHQTDCLVDEVVCPGTNLSTVLEKSEERPSGSSQFSIYDTVDHTEHDDTNNDSQQQSQQRRRIVFFEPTSHYQGIIQQDKQYISENTTTPTGESRYVIKIIQPDIVQTDFKKFLQAAMDMATETKFLSVLSHPHILKMRAVGQGDMFSPGYFLLLDRLYDTLLDRIEGSWRVMADHLEHDFLVWGRASKVKSLWAERMGVMRDVAGALAYIHSLGIIYRDIKPENIGFDSRGVVKLFDFGLAKEVRKEDASPNGTYKLTPDTGSLRYMAPEVGNKWPYNFLADAYSFGIMLWEVTSLNRPFAMYTPNEIRDMVMKWGERPKVKDVWPERLKQLMTSAWDSSFRKRPTMEAFRDALEEEVTEALHV